MNVYLIFSLVLLISVILYYLSINKIENFSEYVGENCYANQGNTKKNGDKTFYTNDMNLNYFNRKNKVLSQREKDNKTIDDLQTYKDALFKSQDRNTELRNKYTDLSKNIDNVFSRLDGQLSNTIITANENKRKANAKFGRITDSIGDLSGKSNSNLEKKIMPIVQSTISGELNSTAEDTIKNIDYKADFNSRISTNDTEAYDWQFIPNEGAPMRINPISGQPECLSYNGKDCLSQFHNESGYDLSKINKKMLNPLTCGDDHKAKHGTDGYSGNHWCNKTYNYFAEKYPEQVDYRNCPIGWRLFDKERKICIAPDGYTKCPSNDQSKRIYPDVCTKNVCANFENYDQKQKSVWMKDCEGRYPFKLNLNAVGKTDIDVDGVINKSLDNRLGTNLSSSMRKYPKYKNGVFVNVYTMETDNSFNKDKLLARDVIVSNINFRNGHPMTFLKNSGITNLQYFYLEFFGFIKVPNDTRTIRFRIGSDDGVRFRLASNGKYSEMEVVAEYWNGRPYGTNETEKMAPKPGTFMPFFIDYFNGVGAFDITLEWSLDDKPYEIVGRENYYIDNKPC